MLLSILLANRVESERETEEMKMWQAIFKWHKRDKVTREIEQRTMRSKAANLMLREHKDGYFAAIFKQS